MRYFGLEGEPVLSTEGLARIAYTFDGRSNEIRRAFFDVNDRPTLGTLGYAAVTQDFDERSKRVRRAYFGVDGKPVLSPDGFAAATYLYDARGNEIEYAFFGVDSKPALNKLGIARVRRAFDLRGNTTEMEVFGVDGPVNFFMGCCPRVVYAFDDADREIKATYFDARNREVSTEIVVLSVVPGSTAQRIGLAPGDRILSYDGKKPTSVQQVGKAVTDLTGSPSRIVMIRRGSQLLIFKVAPGRLGINLGVAPVTRSAGQGGPKQ